LRCYSLTAKSAANGCEYAGKFPEKSNITAARIKAANHRRKQGKMPNRSWRFMLQKSGFDRRRSAAGGTKAGSALLL